jgi:hypothetical protein
LLREAQIQQIAEENSRKVLQNLLRNEDLILGSIQKASAELLNFKPARRHKHTQTET